MEINWIQKMMVFGSNLSTVTSSICCLKHQGRGRPKDDDWLTYQPRGVRDLKYADVICEQHLKPLSPVSCLFRLIIITLECS